MALPTTTSALTAGTVFRWADAAVRLLTLAQPVIDSANVFPVADSDTGTNLRLTLAQGRAALQAPSQPADGVHDALRLLARGALEGARGSSGVILSEYLRGFARGAAQDGGPDADVLVAALEEASRCAYAAVGQPRPGTILTAAAGAAEAARAAGDASPGTAALSDVLDAARAGAHDALLRSVDELDVLRSARVLDAGAYGLVLVLDALALALADDLGAGSGLPTGRPGTETAGDSAAGDAVPVSEGETRITLMESLAVDRPGPREPVPVHTGPATPALDHTAVDGEFEVMCVVEHSGPDAAEVDAVGAALRAALQDVGDSVVVVGGADRPTHEAAPDDAAGLTHGIWQVHVHTDHPLDAVRTTAAWTRRQTVVRCLPHQVAERVAGAPAEDGVVACVASPGLVTDLARSGAVVVLHGDAPVTGTDVLRAALETGAEHVTILPADDHTLAVARALAVAETATRDRMTPDGAADPDGVPGPASDHVTGPSLSVAETTSDLHVVAAMSAWVTTEGEQRPHALTAAVAAVRALRLDVRGPGVPPGLDDLLGGVAPGSDAVLTVLAGDLVPARTLTDVTAHAHTVVPGIEVVVLASGRRSDELDVAVDES